MIMTQHAQLGIPDCENKFLKKRLKSKCYTQVVLLQAKVEADRL